MYEALTLQLKRIKVPPGELKGEFLVPHLNSSGRNAISNLILHFYCRSSVDVFVGVDFVKRVDGVMVQYEGLHGILHLQNPGFFHFLKVMKLIFKTELDAELFNSKDSFFRIRFYEKSKILSLEEQSFHSVLRNRNFDSELLSSEYWESLNNRYSLFYDTDYWLSKLL